MNGKQFSHKTTAMKIYILEDELLILQHLIKIIASIPHIEITGTSAEITKAKVEIPLLKPNIVLADVKLKDGNSFELFNQLADKNFHIIFLTAFDQYAIEALNLGALGYLIKPVDEKALTTLIEKCTLNSQHQYPNAEQIAIANEHYLPPDNSKIKRIALKTLEFIEIVAVQDILYCKSDRGYTTFYLVNKTEILVSKGLKEYESILTPIGFIRCHQSYLVNFQYVKKYYRDGFLLVGDKEMIPVSGRKKEEVLTYLDNIT